MESMSDRNLRYSFGNAALPQLSDVDQLQLYHLRSFPHLLLTSQIGQFNLQTSGLAFRSSTSSEVVVFLYEPQNYSACFLPVVGPNVSLEWDTRAVVNVLRELDATYWQQSTYLAHVNGVVYANYIHWVTKYVQQNAHFVPHNICSSSEEDSCFVRSHTWDNFVADSLLALANLAVKMRAILPPRATKIEIISFVEPKTITPIQSHNETLRQQMKQAAEGFILTQQQNMADSMQEVENHVRPSSDGQGHRHGRRKLRRRRLNSNSHRRSTPMFAGAQQQQQQQKVSITELDDVEYTDGEGDKLPPDAIDIPDDDVDHNDPVSTITTVTTTSSNTDSGINNITNSSLISNSSLTNITNSTATEVGKTSTEWLVEKPPASMFDRTSKRHLKKNVTDLDVVQFYLDLMTCMQEYQLESYSSAFRSCLKEEDAAYIYLSGGQYRQILPRYPFIYDFHYNPRIPDPQFKDSEQSARADTMIGSFIIILLFTGVWIALIQLKVVEWCKEKRKKLGQTHVKRGRGDSVGLRVWHQHNWRDSPSALYSSPTPSFNDLLAAHYHTPSDSSANGSGSRHVSAESDSDKTPLLTSTAESKGLTIPALHMPHPRIGSGIGSMSWDVGLADESSPPRASIATGYGGSDSARGILFRTSRVGSGNELSLSHHISIINANPRLQAIDSKGGEDDQDELNDDGDIEEEEEDVFDDGVNDVETGIAMNGLGRFVTDAGSQRRSQTDAGHFPRKFMIPSSLHRTQLLVKGSPLTSTDNLSQAVVDDNDVVANAAATIDRLIDKSRGDQQVGADELDAGKSRRRSAAGVEPVDYLS